MNTTRQKIASFKGYNVDFDEREFVIAFFVAAFDANMDHVAGLDGDGTLFVAQRGHRHCLRRSRRQTEGGALWPAAAGRLARQRNVP